MWLVRDGRLEAREVEAGPVSGGFREIRRGLSGGEQVVTGGVENPKASDAGEDRRLHLKAERSMALVEIRDVYKHFHRDAEQIDVFTGLSMDIEQGSFTALMGPSGSGKSTLLNLIAGLDKPTSGTVRVGGAEVSAMTPAQLAAWRSRHVGFVFQPFNLLPVLTAFQNVELPLLLTRLSKKERDERVAHRARRRRPRRPAAITTRASSPAARSSGWPSRAPSWPIPTLVLLDEPTGQLDAKSSAGGARRCSAGSTTSSARPSSW